MALPIRPGGEFELCDALRLHFDTRKGGEDQYKNKRTRGMIVPISFFRYTGDVVTSVLIDRTRPFEMLMQVVDILGYSGEYPIIKDD